MASRILFEGYNLTLGRGTGIATYARNLNEAARAVGYQTNVLLDVKRALSRRDPILNEISLFDNRPQEQTPLQHCRDIAEWLIGVPFGMHSVKVQLTGAVVETAPSAFAKFDALFGVTGLVGSARRHFIRYGQAARVNVSEQPAVFHATHPVPLSVRGCPNIYTVHDIIPLRLPYTTLDNKKYFIKLMRNLCRRADHIVTVSECTRRDIIKFFDVDENRITNTYQAVKLPAKTLTWTSDQVAATVKHAFELEYQKYFLFAGAIEPKKNLSRLIDAYVASGSEHPLVIVGGLGWQYDDDLKKIENERFLKYRISDNSIFPNRQIRRLSYVSLELLVALMRGARGLLFPSLYEGFGLPVLEAFALGTPVMTSNVSSLPELAGDAALLINPMDVEDIAKAIRTLDNDADLRVELGSRGQKRAELFSHEVYQARVADLYRRVIG